LLAVENVLLSFANLLVGKNILLRVDSTVALAYINKFGGCRSPRLHLISKRIFKWAEENNITLTASYINSKNNIIADYESRVESDDSDWKLNVYKFNEICTLFNFSPKIDLFATYLTTQCNIFCSWLPDPSASYIDAFTLNWSEISGIYAFPPFCLVFRALRKLINDRAEGLFIVPYWPTQPWFPIYKDLLRSKMIILEPNYNLLQSFVVPSPHPLSQSLRLVAGILSAKYM